MNILFIGDISGRTGRRAIFEKLYDIKAKYAADFVIANGENSSGGSGITKKVYEELQRAGIDVFTLGNHAFSKKEVFTLFSEGENVIRPANLPEGTPGCGMNIFYAKNKAKVAVINLIGQLYMDKPEGITNPFLVVDELIGKAKEKTNIIIVDMHAEATSEKEAMGWYLDGKVSAVIGTHTHVQTADETILPKGTAYITDVGMTGAQDSILGVKIEPALNKFLQKVPARFEIAGGKTKFCAVVLNIDEATGKALAIERIYLKD
ncbi:MAG: TIGR00282 family metallophosphoesterase [Clostridiaceae bacterium]|nr:TIGR00282 family metallophosphoesterase [Clostridiaceae bacterium]